MDWIEDLINEYLAGLTLSSESQERINALVEHGRTELQREPTRKDDARESLEELLASIAGTAVTAVTEPPADEGAEERLVSDQNVSDLVMRFCPKWPWC